MMMEKRDINIVRTIVLLALSIICVFSCSNKEGYELIFLYPFTLVIVLTFTHIDRLAKKYIGIKILYVTILIKYALLPFCLCFANNLTGVGIEPESHALQIASILQSLELIVVSIVVWYFGKTKLDSRHMMQTFSLREEKTNIRQSYFIEIVLIIIALFFILIHPDLLRNFSFLQYDESTFTVSYFRGMDIRIIQIALMVFFCTIVSVCRKKYIQSGSSVYYIISLIIGVFSMLVIKGENRASLLINIIAVYIVLVAAFPQKRKNISITIFAFGVVALVLLSLYRMLAVTAWRPQGGTLDFSFDGAVRLIQAYLSGPRNVAQGIGATHAYSTSFNTFISDIFVWSGYIGNSIASIFDIEYLSTSLLFNRFIYGNSALSSGDQIVPLCVQSLWYLGYLGSLLFSALVARLVVKFDELICKSDTLPMIYINTIMAVVTGLMLGYNVTIISMYFMDRYLIFLVFIAIARWWNKHIRVYQSCN